MINILHTIDLKDEWMSWIMEIKTGFCFVLKIKLWWNASYNFWEKSELFWVSKWTKMSLYYSSKIDAG